MTTTDQLMDVTDNLSQASHRLDRIVGEIGEDDPLLGLAQAAQEIVESSRRVFSTLVGELEAREEQGR
jgi:hypothetical protein